MDVKRDEQMERATGPRKDPRQPIFRDHNCGTCRNGELPCRQGSYNLCDNPRARND